MKPEQQPEQQDDNRYELLLKSIELDERNLKFDRYHRKPITKLLIAFLLFGIIALVVLTVIALYLSNSKRITNQAVNPYETSVNLRKLQTLRYATDPKCSFTYSKLRFCLDRKP